MNGIIIVDKPADWTSHDVAAKLRGAFRVKRVGHGGTLDPMATGVLPVFIGRATRAAEFCENAEKEYIAGLRLGITTDTQDITGNILSSAGHSVTTRELTEITAQFTGAQKQIPPMYSAVKIGGKKLYEIARRGGEIARPARDIVISELEILECAEDILLRVVCSKGTYIRTICHDIGQRLGCGGVMSYLRRIRAGAFTIDNAYTLADILDAAVRGEVNNMIRPTDTLFAGYPDIVLTEAETARCKNGAVNHIKGKPNGRYRVYDPSGSFLMLGEVKNGILSTVKSFYEVPVTI